MHRVAHLTTVHDPLDTRIFHKEARSLCEHGYDVTIAGQGTKPPYIRDGVRIVSVRPSSSRAGRMTITMLSMVATALAIDAQIYHLHDPELIPLGFLLKFAGKSVIYDAHEDLPHDVEVKEWIPALVRPHVARLTKFLLRQVAAHFDGVVASVDAVAERFRNGRVVVVRNLASVTAMHATANSPGVTFAATYCGSITRIRGIREMVEAFAGAHGSKLALAGDFEDAALESEVRALPGWTHVEHFGRLPHERVAQILAQSRAGLCVLHPTKAFHDSLPVKIFEYFAAGIPVIASDFPLWRELVGDCGMLVDPNDPRAIAEAIAYFEAHPAQAKEMGERGRRRVLDGLNWEAEARRLFELYDGLCSEKRFANSLLNVDPRSPKSPNK